VPDGDDPTVVTHGDRKPGPGMLLRASSDLGLDPAASWMVGDMISDVLAGINAGCKGSLMVRTGKALSEAEAVIAEGYRVVPDLPASADLILGAAVDRP
jgi:D-glycero-D-manno-heptose 1,7-bisphosphate phosphatase